MLFSLPFLLDHNAIILSLRAHFSYRPLLFPSCDTFALSKNSHFDNLRITHSVKMVSITEGTFTVDGQELYTKTWLVSLPVD